MSDGIDPSSQVRRPRPNEANSSNGTLSIILAVVAVVAGFLILRSLNNNGTDAAVGNASTETATATTLTAGTVPVATTTTVPAIDFSGATILVANANDTPGTAGSMTDALKNTAGATMVEPTDATSELETSQILYNDQNPAALKVATSLSLVLSPSPTPTPLAGDPPIEGDRQGADVIFLLGKDLATASVTMPVQPATTLTIAPTPETGSATAGG